MDDETIKYQQMLYRTGRQDYPMINGCYPYYLEWDPGCWYTQPTTEPKPCDVDEVYTAFVAYYTEFNVTEELTKARIQHLAKLYPKLACDATKMALLLAHDLAMDNEPYSQNIVSSAHVGDVSTSYDTSYTSGITNPFWLWLSRTKYGNQLIMLLYQSGGMVIA